MALNIDELAEKIAKAISATDAEGKPIEVTPEMKKYAEAIITTLKGGLTVNAPGTVTGTTAAGSPLQNGAASNGLVTMLLAPTWAGIMLAGFSSSNPGTLAEESVKSTTYLMGAAKVEFALGNIKGNCTSTPTSPGPLVAGEGTNGIIKDLSGDDWAKIVAPPLADPALAARIYTEIVDYIHTKSEVTYLVGSVIGTCPQSAGPLALGAATAGVIK